MQMIRPESNWKRNSAVCEVARLQLFPRFSSSSFLVAVYTLKAAVRQTYNQEGISAEGLLTTKGPDGRGSGVALPKTDELQHFCISSLPFD